jgi:hypothetical protein
MGSTPSAAIIATTMESESISAMVGSAERVRIGIDLRWPVGGDIMWRTSGYSAAIPNLASSQAGSFSSAGGADAAGSSFRTRNHMA